MRGAGRGSASGSAKHRRQRGHDTNVCSCVPSQALRRIRCMERRSLEQFLAQGLSLAGSGGASGGTKRPSPTGSRSTDFRRRTATDTLARGRAAQGGARAACASGSCRSRRSPTDVERSKATVRHWLTQVRPEDEQRAGAQAVARGQGRQGGRACGAHGEVSAPRRRPSSAWTAGAATAASGADRRPSHEGDGR